MADTDLKQWIVPNATTAERIADVQRIIPQTLLDHDDRTQRLYQWMYAGWRQIYRPEDLLQQIRRLESLRDTCEIWSSTPGAVLQEPEVAILAGDLHEIHSLTQVLGLGHYRWLPMDLWFTFAAQTIGARVEVSVYSPDGLEWDEAGRQPKRTPSGRKEEGASRLEDLPRDVLWWYLCTVKVPPRSRRGLARDCGTAKSSVDRAIARVRHLMNAIR